MILGDNAHALFRRHLQKKTLFDPFILRNFLTSVGGIGYFLNDNAFETKVYLQNYLALLADAKDTRARWRLDAYAHTGERVARKEGVFSGSQGAVIEISKLGNVGAFGIVHVSILLDDNVYKIDQPVSSIFYTEFSQRGLRDPRKIISHSLGSPVAGVYDYERSFTGIIPEKDSHSYLLVANGSSLKSKAASSRMTGILEITNSENRVMNIPLPDIHAPLGTQKVDLSLVAPEFNTHIEDKPFNLKIKGRNILSKPFLYMVGKHTFLGDHL